MAWSRVYRIYYDKSRRLSLSSSGHKARYLSYIQNSYASVHSFGTPSITSCSVIPPSCPALSTVPVVVAIGPAGSVPIGQGDPCGMVRSARGPVGVVVRFGVRTFGSDFGVGLWGRTLGGLHISCGSEYVLFLYPSVRQCFDQSVTNPSCFGNFSSHRVKVPCPIFVDSRAPSLAICHKLLPFGRPLLGASSWPFYVFYPE